MASRPRRSAAQKAGQAITDWADSERASTTTPTPTMSTRTRRSDGRPSGTTVTRDLPSSSAGQDHLNVTIKTSASKLREATSSRGRNTGGTIAVGGSQIAKDKPSRGTKRTYVESDSLDEDDDDDEMEDLGDDDDDDDAEGDDDDDDMDVDADGDDDEEDADGDVDMDGPAPAPKTIKIHNPKANRSAPSRRAAAARVVDDEDEDDEEELSEIEVSDPENAGDMSINVGGREEDDDDEEEEEEEEDDEEEDAEGEDDNMEAGQDDEEDAEGEIDATATGGADDLDSDEDGSRERTPDLSKMTRRQRARFEDEPQSYMKLSDEVQAKKVFTAEELSMRRQEMARRRRNLSEKRNEEVKMETINKLLKKQAPKTTRKANAAANDGPGGEDSQKPDITLVRWVSNKDGSRLAIPGEMLAGPSGKVFKGGFASGKMIEEVK